MTTSLLISVRSDLARKVISGEKLWEMRKSAPKTTPDYLIVYAKKPTGMAIGVTVSWMRRANGRFEIAREEK